MSDLLDYLKLVGYNAAKENQKMSKKQNDEDKALYRALATQLVVLAFTKTPKPERYRAAADACRQVADRLDNRAALNELDRP
jgi:hypothetical protein